MTDKNKKPLRILFCTPWMEFMLGAEVHFYTIAMELIARGHSVSMYTYLKGPMWNILKNSGINLLEQDPKDEYDITILNGNACIGKAPRSSFKIMISNGIVPSQEYPVLGADRYVTVSEEIHDLCKVLGHDTKIIRNGIDCDRFHSIVPINKKLKNVLLLSNKQAPQTGVFKRIYDACKSHGLNLSTLGLQFGTAQWSVEKFINQNDLVITIGRGVLEAMACERNVLVLDYHGSDGLIDHKNYYEIRKNNCSGRRYHAPISQELIEEAFDKYDYKQGKKNREVIVKNNNIRDIVQNYLDMYKYRNMNI